MARARPARARHDLHARRFPRSCGGATLIRQNSPEALLFTVRWGARSAIVGRALFCQREPVESADSGSEGEHRARDLDGTALSGWAALAVLVGTTMVVAGWLFGMPALREPLSRTMKVNTAIALVLFAVALLFARRETAMRVAAMRVVAIRGAVIGFVTVVEYAAGIELRID